jgi:hypothetical protein
VPEKLVTAGACLPVKGGGGSSEEIEMGRENKELGACDALLHAGGFGRGQSYVNMF